jgi:DNA end-binding protein Ku
MMKAIWKGYLKCSLVTIPVRLYSAATKHPLQFHLYHEQCGSQIRQENVCPVCRRPLTNEEIVKGYQYGKDLHVVITEADFQKARQESSDTMEIVKFVAAAQISPIYYTDAYYLAPDGRAGAEAFAVFRQAMQETGRTALAKAVMRNREYLYSLSPDHEVLAAFVLRYPEEIRSVGEIEAGETPAPVQVREGELEMAKTLIERLSGDFNPADYHDEYTETLLKIIRAKAQGQEVKVEPRAEREKVVNLMEALKKSVERAGGVPHREMARAGRRVPGEARKRHKA